MSGSLHKYMRDIRPVTLDLKLALTFALDISRVMEYLHANGIIRCDLKSGKLFSFQVFTFISNIILFYLFFIGTLLVTRLSSFC